jgi:hypothetical protein
LASLATRLRSARPTGCRRARSGGRGVAAPSVAAGAGAAIGCGATRRRSTPTQRVRVAERRERLVVSPAGARGGRRGNERRPLGGPAASATTRAGRAAAPRLHPGRGPAGAPPAP